MKKSYCLIIALFASILLVSASTHGQEMLYGQREHQLSYNGNCDIPTICFNGVDYAAFYMWAGAEDKNSGVHMRRVDRDGIAYGPQRLVLPLILDDALSYISSVWDGSAYLVFFSQTDNADLHIIRVDEKGTLLGHRRVLISVNDELYWNQFPFVVDGQVFFFCSTREVITEGIPYLITVDSELKQKPELKALPKSGLNSPVVLGAALDPDKFLVYLGSFSFDDFGWFSEISKAALLHVDFKGRVKKTIKPAALFNPRGTGPAVKMTSNDAEEAIGPLYVGDGYLMVGTLYDTASNPTYPYVNTSLKIDDTGEILEGPFDLGNGVFPLYLSKPRLLGSYIGIPFTDIVAADTEMMLVGKRGRHIMDVTLHEHRYIELEPEIADIAYSGSNSAVAYFGFTDRNAVPPRWAIYSNIIPDPKFVKPAIVYFQASEGSPFGDNRRLVMWSAAACTDVTLTGPDFEMKNLPPVFHTVVDTNGERTVLRLTISTEDGNTKTRRLVIEP